MIPGDDAVTSFALLLGRLERLNDELVSDVCARHGISASEIRVLAMLCEARGASVRPATISRRVLQTTGGLTATLRRLEADGRITRSDDPDDGRGKRVGLTDQGESFCDQVLTDLSDRYAFALRDLDLEESRTQVMQLIAALERFGNHPSSADWALLRTTTT